MSWYLLWHFAIERRKYTFWCQHFGRSFNKGLLKMLGWPTLGLSTGRGESRTVPKNWKNRTENLQNRKYPLIVWLSPNRTVPKIFIGAGLEIMSSPNRTAPNQRTETRTDNLLYIFIYVLHSSIYLIIISST